MRPIVMLTDKMFIVLMPWINFVGALVSSGTEVSARGGMRRRSIGPEPEPTYSGYEK